MQLYKPLFSLSRNRKRAWQAVLKILYVQEGGFISQIEELMIETVSKIRSLYLANFSGLKQFENPATVHSLARFPERTTIRPGLRSNNCT
jgi:hypothetical protein